jgi:hypothetical protein
MTCGRHLAAFTPHLANGPDRPLNRRVVEPEGCARHQATVEYPPLNLAQQPLQMLLSILLSSCWILRSSAVGPDP